MNLKQSIFLEYLDVSRNPLKSLNKILNYFKLIKILKVSKLVLFSLQDFQTTFHPSISEIHLNSTKIIHLSRAHQILKKFKSIKTFFGDSFRLCCILWKFHGKKVFCKSSIDTFSSCSNILGSTVTQTVLWTFGVFGCIANILNFTFSFLTVKNSTKIYRQFVAFSDCLTAICFIGIVYLDQQYSKNLLIEEENWSENLFCHFLGSILMFSLMFGCMTLCLLTIERYLAVSDPLQIRNFKKFTYLFLISVILLTILMAVLPIFFFKVFF